MLFEALRLVLDPYVLWVILASAAFGLFVGAVPGLTATMATALLVPVTFFMEPVPAIASIVTATAMAIFAGDIPSCLLRMPGTPASAAYTDEAYAMTRKGQGELALGAGLVFSVIGGLFGTAVLIIAAPALAEIALKFSSFEYFWLVVLGLLCAVFIAFSNPLKGIVSLWLGLLVASIGLDNPAGFPRFTFGNAELAGGLTLIPIMIGMFAVSEILRNVARIDEPWEMAQTKMGNVFRGMWGLTKRYRMPVLRGSALGTAVGILPGAGADIAAWMSYAVSKKFSREPEKFGTGHVEGIIEAGASNNSALAGAWVPALVFGIPGDSITAIVIGVLYIKGLNPGPSIFMSNAASIYAIFMVFILANLLMLPLGVAAIKGAKQLLRVPREVLMPVILLFCVVGSFAINNSIFGVVLMLVFGLIAYVMEENGFPVAPAILGMVLGAMLEEHFIRAMIRADGSFLAFFERPIAGSLGMVAIVVACVPLIRWILRSRMRLPGGGTNQ
ncbi:MAG TPA: tripartite tricarboxylate transporter permease [Burkholderiales bacterium]|nr:tripartite tricarboxylate transporter permease [Burkholderiales bacterium]